MSRAAVSGALQTYEKDVVVATELQSAYDHCQRIAKRDARNFYYAFRALPAPKRRAIYAVYAFCRACDDIADGDLALPDKRREFAQIRRRLAAPASDAASPVFVALRHATDAYRIPPDYYEQILQGVELDLTQNRFADFQELRDYCYKVASVVGLVCIRIFGYRDPQAEDYAVDMGIAMQLTNILRDIKEDAARDRIYLPQDEMRRYNYTESELKRGEITEGFAALMQHQTARAREYFRSSRNLFPLMSPDARACPQVMHATYATILDRIQLSGYDVFQRRIGVSFPAKLLLLTRLWAGSLLPMLLRPAARE